MFSFLLTTTMARPRCKPRCAGNNVHEWKDLTPVGSARALCIVVYPRDHVSQTRWPVCSQLQTSSYSCQCLWEIRCSRWRRCCWYGNKRKLSWRCSSAVCSQCFGNKFPPAAKLTAEESFCACPPVKVFSCFMISVVAFFNNSFYILSACYSVSFLCIGKTAVLNTKEGFLTSPLVSSVSYTCYTRELTEQMTYWERRRL